MAQPYVGEIRMFAGNFNPAGWELCNGQLLAISENDTLFNLIGTTYGGDGQTTFALPNLQSRVPIHVGTGFALAQQAGVEQVTLTTNQIPSHGHTPMGSSLGATSSNAAGNVWAAWNSPQYSDQPVDSTMDAGAIGPTGGNQAHDNLTPYLTINFILSLFGVFPSQT
jgi:microcystin-dependent protein